MDDITFVRSHWWLVSEGFSLSTANSDVQKLPAIVLQIPSLMPLKMRKVQARFCGVNCRTYWHKAHKLTEAPKPSRRAPVAPSPAGAWPYQPRNTARHRGGKANFRFAQDPLR